MDFETFDEYFDEYFCDDNAAMHAPRNIHASAFLSACALVDALTFHVYPPDDEEKVGLPKRGVGLKRKRKFTTQQRSINTSGAAPGERHELAKADKELYAPAAELHRRGWIVRPGVLTKKMVRDLLKLQPEGWDNFDGGLLGAGMFVDAEKSRRESRRKAHDLDIQDPNVSGVIAHVISHLVNDGLLTPDHTVSGASLLLAMPDAPEQDLHLDFVNDPEIYSELSDSGKVAYPVSIMFSLEENTHIIFDNPDNKYDLSVGGCAVWKGNQRHAGGKYRSRNVRFHLYMSYKGIEPPIEDGDLVLMHPDSIGPPSSSSYKLIKENEWICRKQTVDMPTEISGARRNKECEFNMQACLMCSKTCGEECLNKPFKCRSGPKTVQFQTKINGIGLRTLQSIKEGQFVSEYVGQVINQRMLNARCKKLSRSEKNHYTFMLDTGLFIDSREKGNLARFINSSCEPNCETQVWIDQDTKLQHVGIFAKRYIQKGEELTFDYQFQNFDKSKFECMCVRCRPDT